jgi:RNA polymerase sigma factor (sigma-70 family)
MMVGPVRIVRIMESSFVRKDLENATYKACQVAEGVEKVKLERLLGELLLNHSRAVCYSVLRRTDDALIMEGAEKVLMHLTEFKGDALFTTWAHRILLSVMYDQRRLDRQRKEVPLETPGFDLPGEPSNAMTDVLLTVQRSLSDTEYKLFTAVAINGFTQQEVAATLSISQQELSRRWQKVVRKLQHVFTQRTPVRG